MSTDPVRRLADRLIREGYVDNEPDALLAAIRLHLAITARSGERQREPRPPPDDDGAGARMIASADVAEFMMQTL